MADHVVEFIAKGAPRVLSRAIEEHARGRGAVSVLLVPWESDQATLRMAVTLVTSDGWAIEHTNLGTVTLTDLGKDLTRVTVLGHPVAGDHPEREQIAALLATLGRQIQGRFELNTAAGQVSGQVS
jgi:hypothetical protein